MPDGSKRLWPKKVPVEVTQEWLNTYRQKICTRPWVYIVEGDAEAEVTVDEGADGIPDEGWTKKDISAWLTEKGAEFSGYTTKAKLLALVGQTLNPPAPEPVVEVEEAEAPVEETETGDEE
tara:strand:+ start:1302 stop:1664 length:363 start_codon:yes stop_codon:yes gene_type:complete